MNVEMERGKIDLSKVSSVSGHAISSTEGLITVNTVNGRIYHLEMPLADFDRTLKVIIFLSFFSFFVLKEKTGICWIFSFGVYFSMAATLERSIADSFVRSDSKQP